MEKISINDFFDIHQSLQNDGYKLIEHANGKLIYKKNDEELEVLLNDYIDTHPKLLKPNYNNTFLNVVSSFNKYYGKETKYPSNPMIDEILSKKQYKHVVMMVLDGFGSYPLRKNLDENSFVSSKKICDISAVYPPTTACAIPALTSGLEPIVTGWIGWEQYIKELDRHVVMFRNQDFFTEEKLDFDARKYLPYEEFYKKFNTNVFEIGPMFMPIGAETFKEACDKLVSSINSVEDSFTYFYWNEPDSKMHEFGSESPEAKQEFEDINKNLLELTNKISNDTLIIITADHGHIDVNPIYLYNFSNLTDLLKRTPSSEGRMMFFRVKRFCKTSFVKKFKFYFGNYFRLLSKSDFIKQGYLGTNLKKKNKKIERLIGDYVAIATKQYYFVNNKDYLSISDDDMPFKSHHAGLTANEMIVPLIVVEKN